MACTFSACKHRVSGSLSLPSRGSFHLSLTVLCAIGRHIVFRLGRWSSRLHAGFLVSCATLVPAVPLIFSPTGLLPSLAVLSMTLPLRSPVTSAGPQPHGACPVVWPLSLPLAATQEIIIYFLFLRVLRCFSSPGAPHKAMDSLYGVQALPWTGFPIRISPDQCLLAAPRSLSQLAASFVGVWRHGIHPVLFVA